MKVIAGLKKACEKRPVSITTIEEVADRIEQFLQSRGEKEIASAVIGEEVMRQLYELDKVAYVRFASVYRSFQDLDAFMQELKELVDGRGTRKLHPVRRRSDPPTHERSRVRD
jgi:transcriptional repressor NrdR